MTADLSVTLLWTLAVSLSGFLSAYLCAITLQPRFSKPVTILGYAVACAAGFALSYFSYACNITDDLMGILGFSGIVWLAAVLLSRDDVSARVFVGIMATLIANVSTFFLCGTTLSFVDSAANPYNLVTIAKFICVKLVIFTLLVLFYRKFVRAMVTSAVEIQGRKTVHYLPISLVSFFGFYGINLITNRLGIFPAVPEMRFYFIGLYATICLIFVFEYYQIFSSVFWSSQAQKTKAELDVASKIQKDMLPCIFPAFPERSEFDIFASMEPAKEVGGDFYDFFLVDEDHLAVVIADVSGKGVPAALFMVIAKTLIKNHAQAKLAPEQVFTAANAQLCENNDEGLFVTAWMGIWEISTGAFTYVNAGHNPPLLRRANGSFEYLKSRPGFVLAGMEGTRYRQNTLTLNEGDTLFLYTDGVTEATDRKNQLYGEDRLLSIVNQKACVPLSELLCGVRADIDAFVNGAPQFDDITMLALRIAPKGGDRV